MAVSAEQFTRPSNPFSDHVDAHNFFEDELRAEIRQKIIYFLEFGIDVLFIHGELESGKTTIVQRLIKEKRREWESCYISAEPNKNVDSLLQMLADCFGIRQTQAESILGELADRLTEIHSKGKQAILFIDNAQLLNAQIFKLIASITGIKIAGQPVLRVALIGRNIPQELSTQLGSIPGSSDLTRVEVPPFNEEQTNNYIFNRLAATNSTEHSIFSTQVIEKIFKQSKGQPSHINALAYAHINQPMKEDTGKLTKSDSHTSSHYGLKLIALALAISVVVSLFFFRSEQENKKGETQLALPELPVTNETKTPPSIIPEPKVVEKPTESAKEKPIAPAETPVKTETEEPVTTTTTANITSTKANKKQQESTPPSQASTNSIDTNISWIQQQRATNFTLQLTALSSGTAAKTFLKKNNMEKNGAYFKSVRNGKTYYAVIYGSFASRTDARKAGEQLPDNLGINKPWIRSFASIQRSLP